MFDFDLQHQVVVWRIPPELDLQQVLQVALLVVYELLALHPHQLELVMLLLLLVLEQQVQEHCTPWWLTRW